MRGRAVAPRRSARGLGLALCVLAARAAAEPDPSTDASAAELERVFHRRQPERAPVMLIVDGVEVAGDGPVVLELARSGASPLVPSVPVIAALAHRLRADARTRLLAAARGPQVSVDALRAIGLGATYDPRRLELRIAVPPDMTSAVSHDVGRGAPLDAAGALRPNDVSGFVNLRAGGGGTRSGGDGSITHALHLNSDATVNVRGWVLEARGDLATQSVLDAPPTVHRGDVVLTRDVTRHAVRLLAGDLAVPAAGLQSSYPILGVGVGRNFALQPYKVLQPIGSFDFVLDRPSAITVLVNGAVVQTLRLPAGRHDIRNLPLGAGLNDVELLIKDDAGIVRRIVFSAANPGALLAPGIKQFSLSVGVPLLSDLGLRTYDAARPIVSGRYRAGVTSMLTLGGSFDGDLDHQVGGGALAIATRLGSLSLDAAESRERMAGDGFAVGARYDYSRSSHGTTRTLAAVWHRYSPGFLSVGPQAVGAQYSSDALLAIASHLPAKLFGRLSLRYQVGRDAPDAQYASFGVLRSFGDVALDATVSVLRDEHTHDDARLFVTARWVLGARSSVTAASRTSSAGGLSNEATYSRRSVSPAGGVASSLRLSENSTQVGAGGNADFTGYRYTTSLAVDTTLDRNGGDDAQTASVEAATALAFAGGRVAWSRPIGGSFVLVERNPSLDGVQIGVNPVRGGYAAENDAFGPAVLPNLEAYRINRISVEAPALPVGSSLGPASYALFPTYRSGTLVRVGEAGTVFVRGVVLHYNGEPLALAVAYVLSLDDARPPVMLMTNRAGRFSAAGLRPGRYAVRLAQDTVSSAEFEIPSGTVGIHAVGVIEVK